jgi:hypothetical protein
MPIPIDFLRGMLGVLCVLFAHMTGRAAARVYRGEPPWNLVRWLLRTAITGLVVSWRYGLDGVLIATIAGAVLAAGAGALLELRSKGQEEDLSKELFPRD